MGRLLLNVLLWEIMGGFITFCLLYAFLAKAWRDQMGRHILFFMGGFVIAFGYAIFSKYVKEPWLIRGWNGVLIIISVLVWWRVAILIKFQIAARRGSNEDK